MLEVRFTLPAFTEEIFQYQEERIKLKINKVSNAFPGFLTTLILNFFLRLDEGHYLKQELTEFNQMMYWKSRKDQDG